VRLRPGSFAWFVAHDLRQSWRGLEGLFGGLSSGKAALLIGAAILALHAIAYPAAKWVAAARMSNNGADLNAALASGVLLVLPWMIAQAMVATTRALYSRGDLDLIFAAPVSSRAVLAARALSIAIDGVASVAILLLPLANMNAMIGHWTWLAVYPALAATGLFGSAIGIALALGLFAAFGPRRARLASQIAGTAIGASFVLGLQGLSMLPASARAAFIEAVTPPAGGWEDPRSLLWLPAKAAAGDLLSLLAWCAVGIAVFAIAALAFGRSFASAALLTAGAASARSRDSRATAFRSNLGATLRAKERRLLWRDPWLMSQIMLQVVYTLPVSVILWRNGGPTSSVGVAFAPTIVVIAAQLAGSLAWVALSGEDAPEFLATAPVTRGEVERRKIESIAAPIIVILGAPLTGLAITSPWAALLTALFAAGAGTSTALLNLWRQAPARRSMVLRRHSQSKLVGLIEHLLSILWAVGAVMAIVGSWAALIPIGLAMMALWLNRPRAPRRLAFSLPASA
jgi:ABC-2 type transport system permease protein